MTKAFAFGKLSKQRERGKRERERERERKERAFCLLLSKEEEAGEVHYLLIKRPPITTVTANTRIPFRRIFNWEIGPMKYFFWTFR